MDKAKERAEKVKNWLKNPYNFLFVLLILLTVGMRLYYFSLTANQPTWWDEGDYLAVGKEMALPSPEKVEWWGHFAGIRPPLMPLIWAFFIKFGISEAAMRLITEVLPSIFIVIFTYLLASSLFNKKIGLIVGYSFSIYWVLQFYSYRFLTDIPTVLFAMMSFYYFWEYYVKQEKAKGLYWGVFFGVLGFLARFTTALSLGVIAVYLIATKKHKIFTDKKMYIAALVGLVSLIPYGIYNYVALGGIFPAGVFYLTHNTTVYNTFAWFLIRYIDQFLGLVPYLFVLIGLGYGLFRIALSYDIFFKRKGKEYDAEYFVFLWLFIQVFFYVFWFKTGTDRWILLWMPPIFMYMGRGLELIGQYINKYQKYAETVLILIVLGMLSFTFIPQADQLIKVKLDSYKEVQETGLWLRYNTPENAKIMAASIVQNVYYSHRRTYDFNIGTERQETITTFKDPQGRTIDSTYQVIYNETETDCRIARVKPDYMVLHGLEPAFTPPYMYDYPQRHPELFEPVQAFQRNGQTTAIIYKLIDYPKPDPTKVNCTWVFERPQPLNGKTLMETAPERLAIPS